MKTLIMIIFVCVSLLSKAQDNLDSIFYADNDTVGLAKSMIEDEVKHAKYYTNKFPKVDGVSVHQKEILSFIDKNMGKRVDTGICWDLVNGAYKQWDKSWWEKKNAYGREINLNDVKPGDVILTSGEVDLYGKSQPSHVMVVYEIEPSGRIWIAHQNFNAETLKDSKVVVTGFDYDSQVSGNKKITIRFFRAV